MLAISFAAFDAKRQACLVIFSYLEYANIIVVEIALLYQLQGFSYKYVCLHFDFSLQILLI